MSAFRRVVVVGGGVIGAACADFLSRDEWTVTLIDRGKFGGGCSKGNCGLICPSHVLPLAAPGAIRAALTTMIRPSSPFYLRPRLDPSLWSWLFRFARRCNERDMLESGRAIHALLASSRQLYDALLTGQSDDCEWQTRGLLFVFQSLAAFDHHSETVDLLRDSFGITTSKIDGDDLQRIEPALRPGLAGGWFYPNDSHLRPDKLMNWWREQLLLQGVAILENVESYGIRSERNIAGAIQTSGGEMEAEAFVVATGAWTARLGLGIPIQPGKGYSVTLSRTENSPNLPMIFEEHRVAITPMKNSYRVGSTMEFAGFDSRINPKRLAILRSGTEPYLRQSIGHHMTEPWYGWRPMTADGKPYIGRTRKLENVVVAAGHGMLGMSMAPATGKLVAEILSERAPHIDPKPYALDR